MSISVRSLLKIRRIAVARGELEHMWPGAAWDAVSLIWWRGIYWPIVDRTTARRRRILQLESELAWTRLALEQARMPEVEYPPPIPVSRLVSLQEVMAEFGITREELDEYDECQCGCGATDVEEDR